MSASAAVVQLHQRDVFERNLTRAVVGGLAAGGVAWLTQRLGLAVPVSFLALVATALACVRGQRVDRWVLVSAAMVAPALPWVFGMTRGWTLALAGAVTGLLMVKARLSEKGPEGAVGSDRPGLINYVLTGLATAGLTVAGTEVASILASRLQDAATPLLLRYVSSGAIVALFAGLGSLLAHVALSGDPVEARGEEVLQQASGTFRELTERGLSLYRQCGQSLAALPHDPAREELARTVQRLTKASFELAGEWSGVEATLQDNAELELSKEIAALTASAAQARDQVARRQLEMAAQSLQEELARLGEVKLKRERVLAKYRSQLALLERARVALIGMRGTHATVRAAELSAVSRKLSALATAQADEAALGHAVATGVELGHLERQEAQNSAAEALAPSSPAPVSEAPSATPAPAASKEQSH
jgi:hypothetical protein